MKRIIWTPRAVEDLARLRRFLASDNPTVAKRAVRQIRSGVSHLRANPEIGRPADEKLPAYREWLIPFGRGTYVVLYRNDPADVMILTVRHGSESGY